MEQLTITDYLKSQIEIRQVKDFTEWINSQGKAQYYQVRDIISKYLANEMMVDQITNKVSCYILDQALGYAEYLRQQATLEENNG